MLNRVIRADLHIHSFASAYKENKNIVQNSNLNNLDTLFSALEENDINLFSFTDHNRFDSDLYLKTREILESELYPTVCNVLAGVEFDVLLEEGRETCHIIAIFNVKDWDVEAKHIEEKINENLINTSSGFYSRNDFENLLKKINLDVILIAHQKKAIGNSSGGKTSYSNSTSNPYEFLRVGYIDALEYQKPSVEGILQNELKDFDSDFSAALITGSDCHDWRVYPKHDCRIVVCPEVFFSEMKCLPTFRGLLMAVTSPKSRFRRTEDRENCNHISTASISGQVVEFSPGVNVIIGENGSGKSTVLEIFAKTQQRPKPHVKKIRDKSQIEFSPKRNISRSHLIPQSYIINSAYDKGLFENEDSSLYLEVNHSIFERVVRHYAGSLKIYFEAKIRASEKVANLENSHIHIKPELIRPLRFPQINCPDAFTSEKNKHEARVLSLESVLSVLEEELSGSYYQGQDKDTLESALVEIRTVFQRVEEASLRLRNILRIKNLIRSIADSYSANLNSKLHSEDAKSKKYKESLATAQEKIMEAVASINQDNPFPTPSQDDVYGVSSNDRNGFIFKQIAWYNDNDFFLKFREEMFNASYQKDSELENISTLEDIQTAVRGATANAVWAKKWAENLEKYITNCKMTDKFIHDIKSADKVGGTLGELSLAYYKYKTYNMGYLDLILIDQPEDNISNRKILKELIEYFGKLRDKVQIVIVTHNPLLVVNLDADNVIYLDNKENRLAVTWGCLEDEKSGILKLVAKHMDGGKAAVEKRLKVYGKDN